MRLVERHIVKDNRFEDICLKSGLLYNYVLYNIRQEIFSGNYLKEFDLSNKLCKENQFDFRYLPNHVSQQVIKQVFKNIKSWMRLKKDFEKNPSKLLSKVLITSFARWNKPISCRTVSTKVWLTIVSKLQANSTSCLLNLMLKTS